MPAPGGPARGDRPFDRKARKAAFPALRPEKVTALTVIHGRDTARLVKVGWPLADIPGQVSGGLGQGRRDAPIPGGPGDLAGRAAGERPSGAGL